nr:FHA domain-containing protein [Bifidobacterium colobi]
MPDYLAFPGYENVMPGTFVGGEHVPPSTHNDDFHDNDIDDWDSTVLSSSFTSKTPKITYLLHSDTTNQDVIIDTSTLLGRKPSADVPQGAKSVRLDDPTRTISRNHAAISIDTNGTLWIEDYGSLNGTYIIQDDQETQVVKGTPMQLTAPATIRLGDLFFSFTQQQ